jgi:hypothetical protein
MEPNSRLISLPVRAQINAGSDKAGEQAAHPIDPAWFIRDSSGIFHACILEELFHPLR